MNKTLFSKDIDSNNRQIRRCSKCLSDAFLICIGCLFAAILIHDGRWIFVGAALMILTNGILTFRNDRLEYDKSGIVMYSIWGKPFKTSWDNVINVDVIEEPLVSKQLIIGRVLRITCVEGKHLRANTYRFPYKYYIGIDGFLSFYTSLFTKEYKYRKENDN